MAILFTRQEMLDVMRHPHEGDSVGLGLYRQGYRQYGLDFWGVEVASEVKYFLENVIQPELLPAITMIDIAAGTGKNILEFARLGVTHAVAVEIDSIAVSHLLRAVVDLEEAELLPENTVTVIKDDALRFLQQHTGTYHVVICYGLLHVFKEQRQLQTAIKLLKKAVAPNGFLIVQAITDKYPAPISQPELEGVIVSEKTFTQNFRPAQWQVIHVDNKDIEHSHLGADELHRHGSIRAIYQKKPQ